MRSIPTTPAKLGVDLDELLVSQPDSGEQALDIARRWSSRGPGRHRRRLGRGPRAPKAEIEGEMGDSHVGLQARLMSQALRKLTGAAPRPHLPDLHQPDPREDRRDVRQPRDDDRRPGAEVLQLGAHRHPAHRPDQERRSGDRQPHQGDRGQEQDRAAVPQGRVRHPVYNKGISRIGDVLDLALDQKIVQRSGAWFSYGETRLGQGRERVVEMLEENTDLLETIQTQVFAAIEEAERARENKGKNGPEPRKMQGTGA
jgi:recombination protein RecA